MKISLTDMIQMQMQMKTTNLPWKHMLGVNVWCRNEFMSAIFLISILKRYGAKRDFISIKTHFLCGHFIFSCNAANIKVIYGIIICCCMRSSFVWHQRQHPKYQIKWSWMRWRDNSCEFSIHLACERAHICFSHFNCEKSINSVSVSVCERNLLEYSVLLGHLLRSILHNELMCLPYTAAHVLCAVCTHAHKADT